jgi:pimeloyl-ACP methyl ester carboxylesterase
LLQAARSRRRAPLVMPTTVHIRRSYTECRFGQLHVATAYPSGGGFDERSPLLCLHPTGSTMNFFTPLLPELGRDRSVYAFDLPGYGSSDAPGTDLSIADLAAAIDDFMQSLRLRTADVMGAQLGALVAVELAVTKPQQCRKLVLSSVPHFTPQEVKSQDWNSLPVAAMADGSHLVKEWQRLHQTRGGTSVNPEQLTDELTDALRSRRRSSSALHAMMEYPTQKRLATLRQPGLILKPNDELREHSLRAKSSYAQSMLEELPESSSIFTGGGQRALQAIRQFLDK